MKLVLHPGHSKCGSTSIQKSIIKNRKTLERFGYLIPDPQMRVRGDDGFNPNGETPRPFFRKVMEENDTKILEEKLGNILSKKEHEDKTLLISAENLVNQLKRPSGANIHYVFRSFFSEVKVVYYIKPFDEFLLSAWQQWGYKKGKSFDSFVDESIKTGNPSFKIAAEFFHNTYGRENLTVSLVKKGHYLGNGLLSDFFNKLKVGCDEVDLSFQESNISLNPALCELLSHCPSLFKDIHDESVKEALSLHLSKEALAFQRMPGFVSEKTSKKIIESYKSDAELVANRFLNGVSYESLFSYSLVASDDEHSSVDMTKKQMAIQTELMVSLIKSLSK
ncbi:hypothetical protein [Halomonas caseinilytica]|uniref:hypothetical protein n=1 Tax=Halomonas caseinilytica TaxID=438744 RepID=UPI0008D71F13|nr:hypothetical protein [Halomonas caseinilytica]SEN44538.1 hypothetical protein SAMN04487952_11619 [Halomonas caseinilytica]